MLFALVSFAIPCALVVLLPGPDTLVVIRGLVRGGRRAGVQTACGVLCGVLIWVGAAVVGISALLEASEIGYDLLRYAGAAYLLWIGVRTLHGVWREPARVAAVELGTDTPRGTRQAFVAGLLTDVLNPKVGVTFVTFLPAFVPSGEPVAMTSLALGLEFAVLTAIYFAALITLSGTVARWMQTPHIRRRLDTVTGLVLVGFGIRLATEHRG